MSGVNSGRFSVPRLRKSMLARPRLTNRLHGAIGNGLTVIHAPAGFGKTALLASFVAEVDFEVCWLSLDGSCNSPDVFARQLATAVAGDLCPAGPATSEKLDDLRAYIAVAMRVATAAAATPLLIAIDNMHELEGAEDATEILGWLIETLPEGAEMILCGRALPRLTLFDTRIATGECTVIGSADLAFSEDEVATLAAGQVIDAAATHRDTLGWPAAVLAVVAGSVSHGDRARTMAAWEQYLATEIWDAVPEEVKGALLAVSIPLTIEKELAETLAGREQWLTTLRWLERFDFLVEYLERGDVRLNPLLRQFLYGAAERTDPDAFARRACLVARHLEAAGDLSGAIETARDAHLTDVLLEIVRRQGRELVNAGQFALLGRAYGGLAAGDYEDDQGLRALRARVLAHTGRPGEALGEAESISSLAEADPTARIDALFARHRALRLLGRGDEMRALFGEFERVDPPEDRLLVAEMAYFRAQWLLQADSDFIGAERLLHRCLDVCDDARSSTLRLLASSTLGQLLAMRGAAPAAVNELTRAAHGWRETGRTSNLGWVLNNLGMAHLSVGDFPSAVATLEEAVNEAKACENQRNLAYATASLAEASFALGRFDSARESFEEAIRICAEEVPDETLASLSIAGLAGCLLAQGDIQQADYFAQRALLIAESVGTPFEEATCLLTQSSVHSAADDNRSAISALHQAIEMLTGISAEATLRVALYRLALCHFRAHERTEAQHALGRLAETGGEPWTLGVLIPVMREHPMFAQWAAARGNLGPAFRDLLERQTFGEQDQGAHGEARRYPRVSIQSLGQMRVAVGGREVSDEVWASLKSKELFFLFLANRDGLRKEKAVERLYPELEMEKCNSAFHSNLYRVRKALYHDSVIKRDGAYLLNPEGEFCWDIEEFQSILARATELPAGSDERARLHQQALELYRGPFGEAFYSEWAGTLRQRIDQRAQESLATLAGYYAAKSDYEAAASCMQQLLARDGANEEAAYQLAAYRARAGQPAVALAFLDDYGRALQRDYGIALSARARDLRTRIASGHAV
ncbi:MAG: tetratricopeptide repeat protein [Dehalococcoidia bacterium]